jgi:hypothetical protein
MIRVPELDQARRVDEIEEMARSFISISADTYSAMYTR